MNTKEIQKSILENKIAKVLMSQIFLSRIRVSLQWEVGGFIWNMRKKKDDLGEELADVFIYLLGLAEILGIDLEQRNHS